MGEGDGVILDCGFWIGGFWGTVHRRDAEGAKRSYFSLAVDPVEVHGTGTPAREKIHFIWDIAIITDIKLIKRAQILVCIVNEIKGQ